MVAILPDRFGKWNSVWKRFDRLSKAGVFETFFDHLAALSSSAHLVQMFDSTVVRAHQHAAGARHAPPGDVPAAALAYVWNGERITKVYEKSEVLFDFSAPPQFPSEQMMDYLTCSPPAVPIGRLELLPVKITDDFFD